jgi:hypothetical protein
MKKLNFERLAAMDEVNPFRFLDLPGGMYSLSLEKNNRINDVRNL